ncbi:hypothetical protein DFJ74DRAFT_687487 [Hyaloraphidium curvatum]|nr:hypothetical protein DFJ74DRAFT_687487 [Hyaloraphidium curvatum]
MPSRRSRGGAPRTKQPSMIGPSPRHAAAALAAAGLAAALLFVLFGGFPGYDWRNASRKSPRCPVPGSLPPIAVHREKHTSQGQQDGIIASVFAAVGTSTRFFVEFGFDANSFERSVGANTFQLYRAGWRGLLLDGGHENASINLRRHMVTPASIVPLFELYKVPRDLDYLSIDIDGADLFVLIALLRAGFRPRLVSVEYNSNYSPASCLAWSGPSTGQGRRGELRFNAAYGTSLPAAAAVGEEFGYGIVAVEPCMDVFLLRCDLFDGTASLPTEALAEFTCAELHHPADPQQAYGFWDVCEYLRLGGGERAGLAAVQRGAEAARAQGRGRDACEVLLVGPGPGGKNESSGMCAVYDSRGVLGWD